MRGFIPYKDNALLSIKAEMDKIDARFKDGKLEGELLKHPPENVRPEDWRGFVRFLSAHPGMLALSGGLLLYSNGEYAVDHAMKCLTHLQSEDWQKAAISLAHAVFFASFTAQKASDFVVGNLIHAQDLEHRETLPPAIRNFVKKPKVEAMLNSAQTKYINNNYPLASGPWIVINQLASMATFATEAAFTNDIALRGKSAMTALFRLIAGVSATGLSIARTRKYTKPDHPPDPRLKEVLNLLDGTPMRHAVDKLGTAYSPMASAALSIPYINLFVHEIMHHKGDPLLAPFLAVLGYSLYGLNSMVYKKEEHATERH